MTTAHPTHETASADPSVTERFESVRQRVADAAARNGRRGSDVAIVAVTKYASIEQIRELLALGHIDLGESRAQVLAQHAALVDEYLGRHRELPKTARGKVPQKVRWHMIGHLQRNKARKVVELCRLVHSIDSLKLAEELQAIVAARAPETQLEVLVQVNVSGERQKYGVVPAAARHLVEQIDSMFNLRVRGLMCMAPEGKSEEESAMLARQTFTRCAELFHDIRHAEVADGPFDILSMGMSADFEIAVECGANLVRVGSAIFGSEAAIEPAQG